MRKASQRGRLSKLARESTGLSLIGIEHGSAVMVWEPDTASLIDLPSQVFEDVIAESRSADDRPRNVGIQKAILSLEGLFQGNSSVEYIEFIDAASRVGTVNASTIERIRLALTEPIGSGIEAVHRQITGRLLELDLANRSFEVHWADENATVSYDDILEPIVMNGLKRFVVADVQKEADGNEALLSMTVIDDVPESRFDEVRDIYDVISEQQLNPIVDFSPLAMDELDEADKTTLEEFSAFIRSARSDEIC